MAEKKILFLTGSPNQTTQMHQVARELPDYACFFSQVFTDNYLIKLAVKKGLLETTVLSGEFKKQAEAYFKKHELKNDYAACRYNNRYDLVVLCSDMLVPQRLRRTKTVWIQEGMTDPVTNWGKLVHGLKLPAYFAANTAFNGASNICDIYCAASRGYREQFINFGTDAEKIFVTGIPNYDNAAEFIDNNFPYHDYVFVATSDIRETFRKDNRPEFITRCVKIADGRQLIFKLHPNENKERAIQEIKQYTPPGTLIYTEGNTNHMIANCEELITQYSTVVYTGIALGKKVYSYFDLSKLKKLAPLQNGGMSAIRIADICRNYIEHEGSLKQFLQSYSLPNLQLMR